MNLTISGESICLAICVSQYRIWSFFWCQLGDITYKLSVIFDAESNAAAQLVCIAIIVCVLLFRSIGDASLTGGELHALLFNERFEEPRRPGQIFHISAM